MFKFASYFQFPIRPGELALRAVGCLEMRFPSNNWTLLLEEPVRLWEEFDLPRLSVQLFLQTETQENIAF